MMAAVSAVWAVVAVAIIRAIVAVPISIVRTLVAAHPHAPLWSPPPAGATIRGVGLVIAVPIRATVVISIRAAIVISMLVPTAVERVGTGASHAVAGATAAAVRPTTHDRASAAMRSTAASTFSRRRTERRAAHGNRRSGQTNRYLAHHDAHSVCAEHPSLSESNSAISDELQRCGIVARMR